MKVFGQFLFLFFLFDKACFAQVSLLGKLSDKDADDKTMKIYSESSDVKFLKKGDLIKLRVAESSLEDSCTLRLTIVEDHYLTGEIQKDACRLKYSPLRGTNLVFESDAWAKRMEEASYQKKTLISQKSNYLFQLNELNNFIYNFNDEKKKVESLYDQKINDLIKEKAQALKELSKKKDQSFSEQAKLQKELDQLDFQITHF